MTEKLMLSEEKIKRLPLYSSVEIEAELPVKWDASEYNMQHRRRGHAVIFNHDVFETDHYAPREGSKNDVRDLRETFSSLLFDVTVHDNLEYSEIKDTISKCTYIFNYTKLS
jgi:caspase-like apoptosis-related cysteine protease